MDKIINVLHRQGVHYDIVCVADKIAKACPDLADFMLRLKERAKENINAANDLIKKLEAI